MKISLRNAAGMAGAVATLLVATACTSATESSSDDGAAPAEASPCVDAAQAAVDKARTDLPLVMPAEPLDLAALKGKKIWVISILANQWTQAVSEGLEGAAEDLDIDLTIFDGQGSVDRWNTGIAQAIAQKADGIALLAVDPKVVSQAVADASAAGIPVFNSMSAKTGDEVLPGIFANFQADNYTDGYNTAAWAIADSGCTAKALVLYGSGVPLWEAQADGAEAAFEELCPDDCAITTQAVDLANMATDMPRIAQTELTKDPDITYVYPAQDSAVTFVEPALLQVNPSVKILSRDGVPENLDALRSGSLQKVDVAMPPEAWFGYITIDETARAILGLPSSGLAAPTRLIDETNVGASNDDIAPAYADFENGFRKVWGVS